MWLYQVCAGQFGVPKITVNPSFLIIKSTSPISEKGDKSYTRPKFFQLCWRASIA